MNSIQPRVAIDMHAFPSDSHASTPKLMLSVKGVQVNYGGIQAVKNLDLQVREGECVSLIGSNGAGKTTSLKAITSLLPIKAGEIVFDGHDTKNLKPWDLVSLGMVMVPEGRGVFTRMSVIENLKMGAYLNTNSKEVTQDLERVLELLPKLKSRLNFLAGYLSGGEQQMLAMARALMSHPRLLLMDEPSMGLSPIMVDLIFKLIGDLAKSGMSMLLVEQNAARALGLANRGYVLESGSVSLEGDAQSLLNNPQVRTAYLGN
jgi:branched-chain amino acid transport system ATP-binding protein